MDPAEPVAAEADGALLSDFTAGAIDAVMSLAGPDADTPLSSVEIRHLGGALARDAAGCAGQPKIDAEFAVLAAGLTPTPELRDGVRAHARAMKDALTPWRADYDFSSVGIAASSRVGMSYGPPLWTACPHPTLVVMGVCGLCRAASG